MSNVNLFLGTLLLVILTSCSKSDKLPDNTIPPNTDNNSSQTAILMVEVTGDSGLDFGKIVTSYVKTIEISIRNDGNSTLTISDMRLPEGFSSDWQSGTIDKQASQLVNITFSPVEETEYSGNIQFTSNATNAPVGISLLGTGISSIYEGDVLLKTQEEVDAFVELGYTGVNGELCLGSCTPTFDATNLTNLLPLQQITSVKRLRIIKTSITTLAGLENIDSEIGISILYNDFLISLEGFPRLNEYLPVVNIAVNQNLIHIDELSSLTSVGTLSISQNINLENINGLANIQGILSDLRIVENPKIDNLDGLANLVSVAGSLSINRNTNLDNFCGIKPLLSTAGLQGQAYLGPYNRYNPNANEIVAGLCQRDIPDGLYHGEMRISNQDQLDSFAENKYTKIEGRLIILIGVNDTNSTITNLTGLVDLMEITESLTITRTEIPNLNGLENLIRVGTYIDINGNESITDYCAIVPLLQTPNAVGSFGARDNLFNPTLAELEAGICAQ